MEQLNADCLIYIAKYLKCRDKISFIMTCKKIYSIYPYIFKNEIVIYKNDNTNFAWIQKYKPTIEVRTLVYKVLPQTIFRNIKHVNLYGQNFKSGRIPSSIFNLTNLNTLHLGKTHIKQISYKIKSLTNLIYLDLHDNEITDLTPCCSLSKLTFLNLSYNMITNIPCEIQNLSKLKELRLDFNDIETISPDIGKISSLKILSLNANILTSIPKTIQNLRLTQLYLDVNNLKCVCECIPDTIEKLSLYNNENLSCTLSKKFKYLTDLCIMETNVKIL